MTVKTKAEDMPTKHRYHLNLVLYIKYTLYYKSCKAIL